MKRLTRVKGTLDWDEAVERFLDYCQSKELSGKSVCWYSICLEAFRKFTDGVPPHEVTPDLVRKFILSRRQSVSVSTVNNNLRALRAFFNFLANEKYLAESPMKSVPLLKARGSIIQTFTPQQLTTLLRMPDRSKFTGYRDYCMMLVLLDTGIRLSEIIGLKVKDLDTETGGLKVLGKGNKERIVYVSPRVLRELNTYLKECLEEATPEWPLFPNQWGKRLNSRSFQDALKEYGKLAGIEGVRVSPHTFRHTFRQALPA